ncbi:MAG: efflux transporter outer membrane subunit [Burkholderiales bacterium]|nr:efflux transporter outer membrane subunit [Burkholderiales bacterium]
MRTLKLLSVAVMLAVTAGCTLAPTYHQPEAPVPQSFPTGEAYKDVRWAVEPLPTWDHYFTDKKVRQVIAMALENNRDLRVAIYNVQAARAQYGITAADWFPTAGAGFDMSASHTPKTLSSSGKAYTSHTYQANLSVAWELDIFGKIQSLTEAALQTYFATEENQYAVQNSLIAEVATAWINVGTQKDLLHLQQVTLQSQLESYKLMTDSYRYGASSLLDLEQARTTVETARALVMQYQRTLAQARNSLNLLVGKPVPESLEPSKLVSATNYGAIAPKGLPSEVLLNRPDVRAAEDQLKAANADIGAARANFFPSISLTASIGKGSIALADLFKGGYGLWSFAPSIYLPLFTGGANISALRYAEAEKNTMVANYELTIQTAFQEVSDALATEGTIERQLAALRALVQATENAYKLSYSRYQNGLDGFLTVLESQRQMVSAQTELITAEQLKLTNDVTLYKVLGGGSMILEPPPVPITEQERMIKAEAMRQKAQLNLDSEMKEGALPANRIVETMVPASQLQSMEIQNPQSWQNTKTRKAR